MSNKPIMPFGKFKGEYIEDIPNSYINYMLNQTWFEEDQPDLFAIFEKQQEENELEQDKSYERKRRIHETK